MIQVTPQMRMLVAVEPVDFRKGIDGLAGICKSLHLDPYQRLSLRLPQQERHVHQ